MTIPQAIGGAFALVFMTASTWTAIRLLRMAMRTKRSPELLMAIGLLGTGTFGFGLSVLAEVVEASDDGLAAILRLLSTGAVSAACLSFAVFTHRVFRGKKKWASALVAITAVLLLGLIGVSIRHHLLFGPDRFDPGMLARGGLLSFVWAWMGIECIRYRATMIRRLAIGLADPIVVNRFTLWAFVSIESMVLNSISTAASVVVGGNAMNTDGMIAFTAILGMSGAVAIYLAFIPPRAYTRWVASSALPAA